MKDSISGHRNLRGPELPPTASTSTLRALFSVDLPRTGFAPECTGDESGQITRWSVTWWRQQRVADAGRFRQRTNNVFARSTTISTNTFITALGVALLYTGQLAQAQQLGSGASLQPGAAVASSDGAYTLALQTDGNLVWKRGETAVWHTGTHGVKDATCHMQADGNMVIYGSREGQRGAVWASNTAGRTGATLTCQADGNLVIYHHGKAVAWTCNAAGAVPGRLHSAAGLSEPLTLHPAQSNRAPNAWNRALGQYGESLVRNFERAGGKEAFNLNVGEHGIDGLIRATGPDGRIEYRVIEVKTLQNGTDFQLNDTKAGKQLSRQWIEDRLATAARQHPDAEVRKAAGEALEQFSKNPSAVKAELHGISIGDNRYVVKSVDPATAAFRGEVANTRVTDVLKHLGERASSEDVRRTALRQLGEFDQLQAASKPRVVKGDSFTRQMGELAGVEERQMSAAVKEASEHIKAPGESRWVKAGGKAFKFIGKVAGPAGVVVVAVVYTVEAAEIEEKFERGELTREQADAEHAKLALHTAAATGGALGGALTGAAIGTFICPGAGTVVGGIVGAVGGCVGAELMMAATGLADTLAEYLQPGVETVRKACTYIKEQGHAITTATREQLREWVGPDVFDETVAVLDSAVNWTQEKARNAAGAVVDVAVIAKDKVVEVAGQACDSVAGGANWTWDKANAGWATVRGWVR